ncbi:MAG: Inosine-5'-monophosphate dehydrogenase [Parcubacteria group bacterium GW2011_GWA2_40_8]|nr:MAG: Inosine-5'-monophosphate dehydrogenase [Parcubacteria group bacterium GW2011_GWA2_40_8]
MPNNKNQIQDKKFAAESIHEFKGPKFKVDPAYEYNDVDLEQQYSDIKSRKEISLATYFSKRIQINLPFVSAPMDTVTGSAMAIALARKGAIGVLPRFSIIDHQVQEVVRVKRSGHFIIENPVVMTPEHTVADARKVIDEYGVGGIVIVDDIENKKAVGIVTTRDMMYELDGSILKDVMNHHDLVTAPVGTTMEQAKKILHDNRIEKLPLIDDKGHLVGLITQKDIENAEDFPLAARDKRGRPRVAAAVGIRDEDFVKRAEKLINAGADALVVDIAHGGLKKCIDATKYLSESFPDIDIISGNVMTAELTRKLIKEYGIPVMADGGIRELGDLGKALATGASTIMMGAMFAGTEETPGKTIVGMNGLSYKLYRGMASLGANLTLQESEGKDPLAKGAPQITPEGDHLMIPAKGEVGDLLDQMAGALRSTMSYIGARTIDEMDEKAVFRVRATGGTIQIQ